MCNRWAWLPAPTQAGQVGGHEGVGTVVAFGDGAEASGLKLGQRVGIKWMASACLNCLACMSGRDACCPSGKISGFYTPGTFQRKFCTTQLFDGGSALSRVAIEYALGPANYVTPIPDGLSSEMAAPLLCGGVTVYAGLKKTLAQPVSEPQ